MRLGRLRSHAREHAGRRPPPSGAEQFGKHDSLDGGERADFGARTAREPRGAAWTQVQLGFAGGLPAVAQSVRAFRPREPFLPRPGGLCRGSLILYACIGPTSPEPGRRRPKMQTVAERGDIAQLLEAHGIGADFVTTRREFPQFLVMGTPRAHLSVGGVLVKVRKGLFEEAVVCFGRGLHSGRWPMLSGCIHQDKYCLRRVALQIDPVQTLERRVSASGLCPAASAHGGHHLLSVDNSHCCVCGASPSRVLHVITHVLPCSFCSRGP